MNAQLGGASLAVKAIDCPSGEKTGEVSAASEETSFRTSPDVTSIKEMSALGQSLTLGVGWWEKARVFPSGDQLNPPAPNGPPALSSLEVSFRTVRSPSIGIT